MSPLISHAWSLFLNPPLRHHEGRATLFCVYLMPKPVLPCALFSLVIDTHISSGKSYSPMGKIREILRAARQVHKKKSHLHQATVPRNIPTEHFIFTKCSNSQLTSAHNSRVEHISIIEEDMHRPFQENTLSMLHEES